MILSIIILVILEIAFRPRLVYTRERNILLWYGRNKRNYIILW